MAQSALFLGTTPISRIGMSSAAGRPTPVTVPWTRPAEWMTLPAAPAQGVSALYGVENGDGNYVAVSCTTASGTYSVNWGDGTSSTGVASGVQAEHLYSYSGITNTSTSSTTLTVDGMRQCIVTITPGSGNLTSINFNVKHSKSGLVAGMGVNWLDLNVQGAYLAGSVPIAFGTSTQYVYYNYLERINIGTTGVFTNMLYMFQGCRALRNIISLPDVTSVISMFSMFQNCYSLQTIPAFPGSVAAVTNMSSMFQNCYSLQTIPAFPGSVAAVTNMSNMFLNCYSLQTIPAFPGSVAAVTSMSSMFQGCSSLETIPAFPGSVAAVTTMSSMFYGCSSLQTIPAFPGSVAAVTAMQSMFYICSSLQTIPAFPGSVAAVTNMQNMFYSCSSLQTIPAFPGSVAAVTTMSSMFYGCSCLQTIPAFPGSVAAVTNMSSMFQGCSSLQTIPAFPGSVAAVTTMSAMFLSCYSLQTIPAFPGSVAAVTNMSNMFYICSSLQTIPAFPGSVAAVTSMQQMFYICSSLQTIPAFPGSVAAVTSMQNMFYSCYSLQTIPALDLSYNVAKDRAPTLTVYNWTLGTGWQYLTTPNRLDKNADGASATTAINPATSTTGVASTGIITATNHGFQTGDRVQFSAITGGAGLTISAIYKISATSLTSSTFTLTDLLDVPVSFSTNITAGTIARYNIGIVASTLYKVTIVVDSISGSTATYTLGGVAGTNLTSATTYIDYITASTAAKLIITPVATGLRMTISSIKIEEVVVPTTIATSDTCLYGVGITGVRRSIDFGGCKLSRAGILNVFNNLGTADGTAGTQTINTALNYGAADLVAAVGTLTTSTSPTINTTLAHGLSAGDFIRFSALTGPTGIATATSYQVAAAGLTTTAFQLVDAATGTTPITYTGTITAGTVNRYDYQIAINKGWTAT